MPRTLRKAPMNRRRFLQRTGLSALVCATAVGVSSVAYLQTGYLAQLDALAPGLWLELCALSPKQAVILWAATARIVGEDALVGEAAPGLSAARIRFIDRFVRGLDAPLRGDLNALFALLESYPLCRAQQRFSRLPGDAQDAILRSWQFSRFALLRQAFHGLKSLCCLAHYQDDRAHRAIDYVAHYARGPL